jgi:uncharacterized protein YcfJ
MNKVACTKYRRAQTMKKITGIVAVAFMAGLIGGGIGERIADEVWTSKTALAGMGMFTASNCEAFKANFMQDHASGTALSRFDVWLMGVIHSEHC